MNNNITVILPHDTFLGYWNKVWCYRSLLFFLSWRDILIRYKQTYLGILWAVFRPLLTSLILFLVFNRIAGIQSGSVPYFLLVFSGSLVWQFIAGTLNESSVSLIGNSSLVTKVYFPRVLLPASVIMVNLLDQIITICVFLFLLIVYQQPFPKYIFLIPVLFFWSVLFSFGLGMFLAALNIKYRDLKYVLPYVIQFWLYVSPIGFPTSKIPGQWLVFYFFNPIAGIVDAYRFVLLSITPVYPVGILISITSAIAIFLLGAYFFFRAEDSMADKI